MPTVEEQLTNLLRRAVGPDGEALPGASLRWELSKDLAFGDLSAPIAFKLTRQRRQAPQQIAQDLAASLTRDAGQQGLDRWIERLEPRAGYINAFFSHQALTVALRQILRERHRYGHVRSRHPRRINVEFVSANPTGPLSIAHGRQAAVGDVIARLLSSQGDQVTKEYYLNDEGRPIELFGRSLQAQYAGQPVPEEGYHGGYVADSAGTLRNIHGDTLLDDKPLEWFTEQGVKEQRAQIERDLERFGLSFDEWTSQRWLHTKGRIDQALERLKEHGAIYEADGATWFASTKFGDDKDRVVRKRDGELTYLAPDIAYHQWKFERKYDQLINLWGPDHHGYITRLKAGVAALQLPADRLTIRIIQLVTLSRKGQPIPMGKRQGEFVTFRELIDEVGVDATRFFFLMRTMESHLDFDLELAKSHSQENPVYYVQYAHARICSILAYSRGRLPWWSQWRVDLSQLQEAEARLLIRTLMQFPVVLRLCAQALEPHGITTYLQRLAETFHVFYTKHRVITEDVGRSTARLMLVKATRQVLANGLEILGVNAPRRM